MISLNIFKLRIKISLLFPSVIALMLLLQDNNFVILCLAASILHEIGHLIALVILHDTPESVHFGVFGMRIDTAKNSPISGGRAVAVATAGPLANLILALIIIFVKRELSDAVLINLGLALFNILPIEPLDGGQALYHMLISSKMDERKADQIIMIVSFLTLIPIFTAGFYMLIFSGYNFTLLLVCFYLALLIILKRSRHMG